MQMYLSLSIYIYIYICYCKLHHYNVFVLLCIASTFLIVVWFCLTDRSRQK